MIKTTVTETKPEFPRLMVDPEDGLVILATINRGTKLEGTVVHLGSYREKSLQIGAQRSDFSTYIFKNFVGTIQLTQE